MSEKRTHVFMSTRSVWSKPNTRKRFSGYRTQLVARGTGTVMYEGVKRETWLASRELARKYLESPKGYHLQLTDPASGDVMGTVAHAERDNLEHDPVDGKFKRELLLSTTLRNANVERLEIDYKVSVPPKLDITRPAPKPCDAPFYGHVYRDGEIHTVGKLPTTPEHVALDESEALSTLNGHVPEKSLAERAGYLPQPIAAPARNVPLANERVSYVGVRSCPPRAAKQRFDVFVRTLELEQYFDERSNQFLTRERWIEVKVGDAREGEDGSISLRLDAVSVCGDMIMRKAKP